MLLQHSVIQQQQSCSSCGSLLSRIQLLLLLPINPNPLQQQESRDRSSNTGPADAQAGSASISAAAGDFYVTAGTKATTISA